MWHSRRKSTFWRKNTKMSYLYHVVALTDLVVLGNNERVGDGYIKEHPKQVFIVFATF